MTSIPNIGATTETQSKDASDPAGPKKKGALADTSARASRPSPDWRRRYARNLWITDLLVLIWVVYGTQIAWLGFGNSAFASDEAAGLPNISYWFFSGGLVLLWTWALGLVDSRNYRVIGTGNAEYVRVARASVSLFGLIAIVSFLTKAEIARGYLLIALPFGITMLLMVRWLWRQWLVSNRRMGDFSARTIIVGSERAIANIANELRRSTSVGYRVVGACTPTGETDRSVEGTDIAVLGPVGDIRRVLDETGADTVIVASSGDLPPGGVKTISWALEPARHHLVLAPNITDIAGPRIHARPVAGLPLIHVETPRFTPGQRFLKRTTDIVGAVVLILASSPVVLGVALAVKLTSPGPLLYKQERIGLNGNPFRMLKFRSMRDGSDRELKTLLEAQGTNQEPLFKVRNDPRITPVGKFIRKYSLDELPQFFNVLGGSMSLVGPRPQVAAEVTLYSDAARRRLLARPGITGLWQVSGRSEVRWQEAVRLDLYYVENWSFLGDIAIIAKTAVIVFRPGTTAH